MFNLAKTQTNSNSSPTPPPPEILGLKISNHVLKLRTTPPSRFFQAPNPPVDVHDLPTGPYFCYGTLTDPCMSWGQYPALVEAPDSTVVGTVYNVETIEHGVKLAIYETNNYRASPCRIHYTDGKEPTDGFGYTFISQGNKEDLSEGVFDLRIWLKRMGRLGEHNVSAGPA
ncbi:hypothetical protein N7513_005501 [Penicillium frequentans]|nr:hypothetical protein N7513_005501 [Penicillium glabrum]